MPVGYCFALARTQPESASPGIVWDPGIGLNGSANLETVAVKSAIRSCSWDAGESISLPYNSKAAQLPQIT